MELKKKKSLTFFLASFFVVCLGACSGNFFASSANTDDDDALIFDAQLAINARSYAEAITVIEGMSAAAQAEREVRLLKATAYGGLCGFEFLTLLDAIANQGSQRLFVTLMKAMSSASSTTQTYCESAIDEVRAISTSASSRTSDENIFMAVAAMAEIGSILKNTVDTTGDGVTDSYDHCTAFSSANLSRMVASMAETITSLSEISGSSVATADMTDITSVCSSLAAVDSSYNFCSKTDHSTVTTSEQQAMKGVIGSDQSVGVGGSTNSGCTSGTSVTNCAVATGC